MEDFRPMWSWSTNVTNRQTDGQTTCDRNTALCTKVHRAVKILKIEKYRRYIGIADIIGLKISISYRFWEKDIDPSLIPKDARSYVTRLRLLMLRCSDVTVQRGVVTTAQLTRHDLLMQTAINRRQMFCISATLSERRHWTDTTISQ